MKKLSLSHPVFYLYMYHYIRAFMKRSRLLLLIVLLLIIVGAVIGLTQWYKPHRSAEGGEGIVMSTDSLIAMYNANEHAADSLLLNKLIQVQGTVAQVDTNNDGQTTVLFASTDALSSVFCTMRDKGVKVDSGKVAVIKGFCSGHTMDVLLTDCVLVK